MAPERLSTCHSQAQENDLDKENDVNTYRVEANSAAAALAAATAAVRPRLFSPGMIRLWIICLIGYTVATINGFDGSLMGSLNAMEQYQDTFGLNGAGASSGIVFIVYNLAQIVAFPLCGLLGDGLGRRKTIAIGCFIILVGTAIQTPAPSMGWFIGGRAVLGLGAAIAQAAAPVYIVEVAHPSFRGIIGGMYNNFWWVGNKRFFAKYHADGNRNAPIVRLQIDEILEEMHLYHDDNPWWDFRELFNTRQGRYRTFMVVCMAFFGQWSGNNVVSYFMPLMLKEGGITNTSTQLLLNAIYPISSMIASIVGAMLLDKVGRRKMLLGGLFGALGSYVMLTAFTAEAYMNTSLIYGVIISIYLFGIFFAGGWTPLQSLYPTECLENRTRAKGAGMKFLFLNIANMTNTFGVAVGIDVIGWKLYLVYIGWLCLEIVVVYLFFVETAGKTLEELSVIFGAKNPVKTSLDKSELIITTQGYGAKIDVTKVA
ncbi:lactose permease [Seiridium cupressi]